MKISKILFTTYFSLMGLLFLCVMVMGFVFKDAKLNEKIYDVFPMTKGLASFKYLNISDGCYVRFNSGTRRQLIYNANTKADSIPFIYEIKNDTLYLKMANNDKKVWCELLVDSLISITGKDCHVELDSLVQSFLAVNITNSSMYLTERLNINKLNFVMKDSSKVDGHLPKGIELRMDVQNSEIQIYSNNKLNIAEGSVTDHSQVFIPVAKHIQMEVDETSNLNLH
jgi:hypothetical protein